MSSTRETMDDVLTRRTGLSFQNAETVDLYLHRPSYPQRLYELIIDHPPAREHLLDLGCGHGKMCRKLVSHFTNITAVDPSERMITVGKSLENGDAPNINWVQSYAEEAPLSGTYDVIITALSMHWMDHDRLFPKLKQHVTDDHLLAVIEGDQPHEPPWHDDWWAFLGKWVPKMTGKPLLPVGRGSIWDQHLPYIDIDQTHDLISDPFRQSIDDFILCQHSRDTFALSKLGDDAGAFDAELAELLRPHADADGVLTFNTKTTLTLAKVR